MNQETPFSIISYYSVDVFKTIKSLIEVDFPVAARAHLVSVAMQEIYVFRKQMQIGLLLNVSFDNLLESYSFDDLVSMTDNYNSSYSYPSTCGLSVYGISECNFFKLSSTIDSQKTNAIRTYNASGYNLHFPSIEAVLNASNSLSILNADIGLPHWLALCYYRGKQKSFLNQYTGVDLGFDGGYNTIYGDDLVNLYNNMTYDLSVSYYGVNISATTGAILGSQTIVDAVIEFLATYYLTAYSKELITLVYDEYNNDYNQVACAPTGAKCVWQWGYMRQTQAGLSARNFSTELLYSLIDQYGATEKNPNNIYYDGNSAKYYNSYVFCSKYGNAMSYNVSYSQCFATNYSYAVDDAITNNPAGLWYFDHGGTDALNDSDVRAYKLATVNQSYVQEAYFQLACNISYLLHDVYRTQTDFHDIYVVKYVNRYKSSSLNHTFSLTSPTVWEELGWAQWGGGYITEALIGVKACYLIKRNGMWYFGDYDYYTSLIEYSSWSITSGFVVGFINNPYDAQKVLTALADDSLAGFAFRSQVSYLSTTYIGDGENYINGVGALGDRTFISESNTASFDCTGEFADACSVISPFITSSSSQCYTSKSPFFSDDCS